MDDNQIFEIEKIGKTKVIKGKLHSSTYEPVENVQNINLQTNSGVLRLDKNDKEVFELDEILKEKTNNGRAEYLVKWKGTKPNSWEPTQTILALLKKFFESRKEKTEKKNGNIETLHKFFIMSTEFDKNISD